MQMGKIELTQHPSGGGGFIPAPPKPEIVPPEFTEKVAALLEWLERVKVSRCPQEAADLREMLANPPQEPMEEEKTEQPTAPILPDKQGDNREIGNCHPPKEHQFKPGQSGNPSGRPKKEDTFSEIARDLLTANEIDIQFIINGNAQHLHLESSKPIYHAVATALISEALKGKTIAIRELLDRMEGKAKQSIDFKGSINDDREPKSIEEIKKGIETLERLAANK